MAFIVKKEIAPARSLIVKRDAIFKIFRNLWSNTSGNFWNLINNPYDKTITNFNIKYIGGQVDINWGEGINPNIPSNTNINHTFGFTTEGISIFPINGADVKNISCGTSSPQLSGTITISSFPNLTGFTCRENGITAFSGIQSCGNLRELDLGFNSLKTFPSFNSTPLLEELRLEENLFTGSIPSLNNLTNLKIVRLQENKTVTGNLPSLSLLTNLESFYAIGCKLRGPIPNLSQNTLLEDFRIDSQTTSPKISGTIPSLSANTNLRIFHCHNNNLSGSIPSLTGNTFLEDFRCYNNQLTGFIPSFATSFGTPYNFSLQTFRCEENQLTGSIPQFDNLSALTDFTCNDNQLTGVIPKVFSNGLARFYCHNNKLAGTIPNVGYLSEFNCSNNQLTGSIPNVAYLNEFNCSNNQLSGSIPSFSEPYYPLGFFDCSNNQLTGSIPSLYNIYYIETFYCNNNRLTGVIPSFSNSANYHALKRFNCSNNQLTGFITNLSDKTNLKSFDCQFNQLSGSIPSLNANSQVEDFYCNNNRLTGFGGGSVSNTLGNFQAQNNFLTSGVVNSILSSFVSANRATGTRILNLGGAGNAAPVGQGITDKAFLISPLGWTVTTN